MANHRRAARWIAPAGARAAAIADALFGRNGHRQQRGRRWWLRYLGIAALLAAIIAARRIDAVTNPQFWGEDGFVYFHDNLVFGFPRALGNFYAGFPHLGQRLIAVVGGFVPFAAAPRVYTTVAIAITALALASFSLSAFDHIVRSDALRVLWCIAAACLPLEQQMPAFQWGGGLSTPANLGWWVAIWLSLLSVVRLPPEPWRIALLALAGAVAVFSTPLALVNSPLWTLRGWRAYRRGRYGELAFTVALLVALAACMAVTRGLGANIQNRGLMAHLAIQLSFSDDPAGYLLRYLELLSDRLAAFVLAPNPLAAIRTVGAGAVASVGVLVLIVLFTEARVGRRGTLARLGAALYVFAAALLVTVTGRLFWANMPIEDLPARYGLLPGAMLLLAAAIALDGVRRRTVRRLLLIGTGAVLALSFGPRFALAPFRNQRWPEHAHVLEDKVRIGSAEPLVIPMNPAWSPLRFEAGELSRVRAAGPAR